MNRKLLQQHAILFLLTIAALTPSIVKPMKRTLNAPVKKEDNKHQKITKKPLSFTDLPLDMQRNIIAETPNKDNLGKTNKALKKLASKNSLDILLKNPLHLSEKAFLFQFIRALYEGQTNVIDNLSQQYPDLSNYAYQRYNYMNDLAQAAYSDDIDEVDNLIHAGMHNSANGVYCTSSTISAPAFIAADLGHLDLLQYLSEYHPDLLEEQTIDGCSLLHIAAQNESPGIMQFLLTLIAKRKLYLNIDTKSVMPGNINSYPDFTPLLIAIYRKRSENVKLLLEAGARIQLPNKPSNFVTKHPAFIATTLGDLATLKVLKQYRPDLLETIARDGYSLLHCAAEVKFPYITKFLLKNTKLDINAMVNMEGEGNLTPLLIAIKTNNTAENILLFLKHGSFLHAGKNDAIELMLKGSKAAQKALCSYTLKKPLSDIDDETLENFISTMKQYHPN